jgi:superfamily II DNA or RNA helicase
MSTRVIKLKLLDREELVPIQTAARTLGEFKKEESVIELEIDWNSVKLIDRPTKSTFELDEAVLPIVDVIMFITPLRTKAGLYTYKECIEKLKNYKENGGTMKFDYTGATTEKLNEYVSKIEEEYMSATEENTEEKIVAQAISLMKKATKKLKKLGKISHKNTASLRNKLDLYSKELAEFITKDTITLEAEELANRF